MAAGGKLWGRRADIIPRQTFAPFSLEKASGFARHYSARA